jgi:hypothetical protein
LTLREYIYAKPKTAGKVKIKPKKLSALKSILDMAIRGHTQCNSLIGALN